MESFVDLSEINLSTTQFCITGSINYMDKDKYNVVWFFLKTVNYYVRVN